MEPRTESVSRSSSPSPHDDGQAENHQHVTSDNIESHTDHKSAVSTDAEVDVESTLRDACASHERDSGSAVPELDHVNDETLVNEQESTVSTKNGLIDTENGVSCSISLPSVSQSETLGIQSAESDKVMELPAGGGSGPTLLGIKREESGETEETGVGEPEVIEDDTVDTVVSESSSSRASSIGAPSTEESSTADSSDNSSQTSEELDEKSAAAVQSSNLVFQSDISLQKPSRRARRRKPRASDRGWQEMPFASDIETVFQEETPFSSEVETLEETKQELKWSECLIDHEDPESFADDSPSRKEWLRQKAEDNQENEYMDQIMAMVGHEEVKAHFLQVKAKFEVAKRWDDFSQVKFDLILHGNKGTGKKRIAEIYANFLYSIGYVSTADFQCSDSQYPVGDEQVNASVLFFQKADIIDQASEIQLIMDKINGRPENTAIIFSYTAFSDASAAALESSPDARNRFPVPIQLKDYTEDELLRLSIRMLKKRSLDVEGGLNDQNSILRIFVRRVSRCREDDDFANIRTLENHLNQLCKVQAARAEKEWFEWAGRHSPEETTDSGSNLAEEQKRKLQIITKTDIVGPGPVDIRSKSTAWAEIQKMVGLESVKKEIDHLFNQATLNHHREMQGQPPLPVNLNRVFVGPPGVGKTTVAQLYGQIVAELGLVSNGKVIVKNPSDLIGKYIGWSEQATKDALEEAKGNILVIDDAHMLYTSNSCGGNSSDIFRRGVIDTLVAEISGSPGDDRCIILAGYPDKMQDMFLNSNAGLQRRFPLEDALHFKSYNDDQLCDILCGSLEKDGVQVSEGGKKVARECLSRMRVRPGFGNGGDVNNLIARAKLRQRERLEATGISRFDMDGMAMEPEDFDPDHDRASRADGHRKSLFQDFVGFDKIVTQFQGYQQMADGMRRYSIDPRPHIPWAFVFKGPPGTGKTSTARKVGRLFYDMGLLSSSEVVTCSVTDLVGQYQGQTGPKVIDQFERGIGKVLFIDEAYRLNPNQGAGFISEAIGELVDAMTKPRYVGNMVVVLAGYTSDMEKLLDANQGLRSRFPTHVTFPHMEPQHCLSHLEQTLSKLKITIGVADNSGANSEKRNNILQLFRTLSTTKGWANGRDVESLAKVIMRHAFINASQTAVDDKSEENLIISVDEVSVFLQEILQERRSQQSAYALQHR